MYQRVFTTTRFLSLEPATLTTTAKMTTTPLLIRFYDPTTYAPDASSHTLPILLSWTDKHLERSHSYIQTLFPLPEPSPVNPSAPVISRDVFLAFRTRPDLRAQLLRGLKRMCEFYGFDANLSPAPPAPPAPPGEEGMTTTTTITITRSAAQFEDKARRSGLLTRFNHNHLRITRMIRSLRVLGCEDAAGAFHDAVVEVGVRRYPGVIGKNSLMFWKRAAERPLWVRPEDEDERVGRKEGFLWEFERGEIEELNQMSGKLDATEDGEDREDGEDGKDDEDGEDEEDGEEGKEGEGGKDGKGEGEGD